MIMTLIVFHLLILLLRSVVILHIIVIIVLSVQLWDVGWRFPLLCVLVSARNVEQWPSHLHLAKAQTLNLFNIVNYLLCSSHT